MHITKDLVYFWKEKGRPTNFPMLKSNYTFSACNSGESHVGKRFSASSAEHS
uniref:Uncharacterized protein n=1 Tax=Rhizophora mucronata TaxID=61149 RepID=A0A2P2IME6_RHIMU